MKSHEMRVARPKEEEAEPSKRRYSKLRSLEIQPVKGGHEVLHHYQTNNGEYREPEKQIFTDKEALKEHIHSKLGVGEKEAETLEREEE